ncbi:biotin transporter BioY [Pseudogemmobacter humi]|uniref:Biotin transporter n=1 Tax=Pseudogemmobacter humi TaxID=2483812 RepID=A0A3P5XXA3_9RHOB|nr:biotin transporter BioY [Pseudogemmobacter humi]VDC33760.1 Biotin transporter BioY [Pseudogemmobacter humi]
MHSEPQAPNLSQSALQAPSLVLGAAVLIAVAAKVQIPFWPVPMTLHTLAVLAISVILGPRLGFAAMATYLAAGLLGFPVFSGSPERGIGLAYALGPTGGYLLGYLLAAGLTGWLAAKQGIVGTFGAMLAGLLVVYVAGLAWLAAFLPASQLLAAGFLPFIIGDLVKIALALMLVTGFRRMRA